MLKKLNLAHLFFPVALIGCSGGGIFSGACEPDFDLSGQWESTLTSDVDGVTRPVTATLDQNQSGFSVTGSIAVAPCWPLNNLALSPVGISQGGGACKFDDSVSISSRRGSPLDLNNFESLSIDGTQSKSQTITGSYRMNTKVSGCPEGDSGVVTMNKVG